MVDVPEDFGHKKNDPTSVEGMRGLFGLLDTGVDNFSAVIHKLIDLAKTNPLWGAVLGIIVVDLMSRKADLLHWTHQETFCNDCNIYVDIYAWFTGTHVSHTFTTVTKDGILSSTANIEIRALIISGFGVAAAGSIIADITKITDVVGSSQAAESIIKPSVTTLVESPSKPIGIDIGK